MGYFPFFVDLEGKEGLIVGGGAVASRKIEKLAPYGPKLTVAAPVFDSEIRQMKGITLVEEPFSAGMLEGKYFAIAAADSSELNRFVSRLCRERGILVNVADDREACTFIFPSLVRKGKLSVGISTEGASPSAAIYMKDQINRQIPKDFDKILEFMESGRERVMKQIPLEEQRSICLKTLFSMCLEKGRGLTEEEFSDVVSSCFREPQAPD